ncbi:MAG: stage III sporulation protein AB [Oscillospiraceae bacterium]|jgi:stage III sporulation protein AB|nr:stage III sporulation protein AB [Oscillospiraceae bacterium]
MLKNVALAMILLACGAAGAMAARALAQRARELEAALRMLAGMRAQLQFSRPPLGRMLAECCAAGQCPAFLPCALRELRAGAAFPQAWRGAVAGNSPALKEEDRRALLPLAEILGALDADGQCEALLVLEEQLRALLEQARARRDQRGKALFLLGILAGLTVMILFL